MKKYLETERIYLREFTQSDEDYLFELDSDPEVMKYLTAGKPSNRESVKKAITKIISQLEKSEGKYGLWAAIEKDSNEFIGWFHLFPPVDEPTNLNKLFLGYRLSRKNWGKGYATEVSKALVNMAFTQLGACEVCAQSMKDNIGSQKVMMKVGMSFRENFIEKSFPVENQDAVMYSIRKPSN